MIFSDSCSNDKKYHNPHLVKKKKVRIRFIIILRPPSLKHNNNAHFIVKFRI